MTTTLMVIMLVSLYITILSGWLLMRNAGKTETNRRLSNIEDALVGMLKTQEELKDSIRDLAKAIREGRSDYKQ